MEEWRIDMKDKSKGIILLGAGIALAAGTVAAVVKKSMAGKKNDCKDCCKKPEAEKEGFVHEYIDLVGDSYSTDFNVRESCEKENVISEDDMKVASEPISILSEDSAAAEDTWKENVDIKADPEAGKAKPEPEEEKESEDEKEDKKEEDPGVHVQEL